MADVYATLYEAQFGPQTLLLLERSGKEFGFVNCPEDDNFYTVLPEDMHSLPSMVRSLEPKRREIGPEMAEKVEALTRAAETTGDEGILVTDMLANFLN